MDRYDLIILLAEWFICFIIPLSISYLNGIEHAKIYLGCCIFWALVRIGDKLMELRKWNG